MNNDFSIFKIGPSLAKLLSILDKKKYQFKIADYHAVLWDWDGKNPSHVGKIDESCYVLTTDTDTHPTYAENICISYDFNNPREDNDILLGLNNYKHPYKDYLNIIDGRIIFYDEEKELIDFPYKDTIYAFIDSLISFKEYNNNELSSQDINMILESFIKENNLTKGYQKILKKDV